jgi:hypothetical protein
LCQGTSLLVPHAAPRMMGFRDCVATGKQIVVEQAA